MTEDIYHFFTKGTVSVERSSAAVMGSGPDTLMAGLYQADQRAAGGTEAELAQGHDPFQ
jgi:hypothetical protein